LLGTKEKLRDSKPLDRDDNIRWLR